MSVGVTILSQIKVLDRMAMLAWGAKDVMFLPESKDHLGGLQFKISTPKYKRGAFVQITLNHMDEYDIKVIRLVKGSLKVLDSRKGVYCFELIEALDEMIDEKDKIFF